MARVTEKGAEVWLWLCGRGCQKRAEAMTESTRNKGGEGAIGIT